MQQLSDDAVAELGRTHFDIPEPIRTLDCKIAPPGGTVGAYYTGPSDDLSRPGAMWWSVEPGREVFSTWREVTTVYHEGVPGHHLQIATAVYQRDSLNDFQRLLAGTSGHAEGWALYAERLMRELGYLDDDPILLGMLDAQLFRAARVVVDIGMHLELEIPAGTGFHEGERWTPDLGLEFLLTRTISEPEALRRRDRPLPRLAGPGAELQGRRAGVDRRSRRGAGPPRRRLRSQGLPHHGAAVRRHGPRPPGRAPRHDLSVSTSLVRSQARSLRSVELEGRLRRTQLQAAAGKAGPSRRIRGLPPPETPDGDVPRLGRRPGPGVVGPLSASPRGGG